MGTSPQLKPYREILADLERDILTARDQMRYAWNDAPAYLAAVRAWVEATSSTDARQPQSSAPI